MRSIIDFVKAGNAEYNGMVNDTVNFVLNGQLLKSELWAKFAGVFKTRPDDCDNGWRGEYWGKMMRGACLIYRYCANEKLYGILRDSVLDLLSAQDEYGRISSYPIEKEFYGWDMWCRKYVLTGLFHFYDICRDEQLKRKILSAAEKHLDYIVGKIGDDGGKKPICKTSTHWEGLNSCSILEPVVEAYKKIGKKSYLEFAGYLIKCGGVESGNLVELAYENKVYPYMYPVRKAYEMMSYFEGILAYAELTDNEYYITCVERFADALGKSDITIIGCAGCDCECLNNGALKQTENIFPDTMQETCVTVTWMRLCLRLYRYTGKSEYADEIERSSLNALLGSLNLSRNKQFCVEKNEWLAGLPFDSYSPLVDDSRGRGVAGFKEIDSLHYGCCAAIGAAGVAIIPLSAVMCGNGEIIFNQYFDGQISIGTSTGDNIKFIITGGYPDSEHCKITVRTEKSVKLSCRFRIPLGCDFSVKSGDLSFCREGNCFVIENEWNDGDTIDIVIKKKIIKYELSGKTAFTYGPFVLAVDEMKRLDEDSVANVVYDGALDNYKYAVIEPEKGEHARLIITDGVKKFLLTDYSSCGKASYSGKISVWNSMR